MLKRKLDHVTRVTLAFLNVMFWLFLAPYGVINYFGIENPAVGFLIGIPMGVVAVLINENVLGIEY